jgi:hypothetical protein
MDDDEVEEDDDDLALNVGDGAEDENGRKLPNLQVVQMRMQSSVRALSDWSALGAKTGKSRSEVMEQFIQDICEYYGYNQYLAEKLVNLFPLDEVCMNFFCSPRRLSFNTQGTGHCLFRCLRHTETCHHPHQYATYS